MAKKLKDLAVKVSAYIDQQGAQKYKYETVGALIETEYGQMLLLRKTFNPAGALTEDGDMLKMYLFEPKEKDAPAAAPAQNQYKAKATGKAKGGTPPLYDDDIPF